MATTTLAKALDVASESGENEKAKPKPKKTASSRPAVAPFLYENNEHHALVDSLMYIEGRADPNSAEARYVNELIAEERRTVEAGAGTTMADSLADEHASLAEQEQAQLQQFAPSTVLESEFQRLASGHKMLRLDLSKYQQIAPPDQFSAGSEQAWKGCLRNARLMSQCNELRLVNLDLLLESGPVAAAEVRKANQSVESQLTNEVGLLRKRGEEVNQRRKVEQIQGQAELRELQLSHEKYVADNGKVEKAVLQLRQEVERLKRVAKKRKLLADDWVDPTLAGEKGPACAGAHVENVIEDVAFAGGINVENINEASGRGGGGELHKLTLGGGY
eukprot:g11867.t1